ncbi:hypothetical protein DFR67_10666 [Williamsia limnetica]|jgi:hypothetical protein|uniref:Uncharacterized protein n=1 Tax=Williamsia limnetica TaxID=882452 RepID=A0A318RMJ0_WILLI|nr:hypothetical protein [Williamsia limnetica]PYE17363.1 hypothetical protein DFR67_10666 [Williamsia limnetica]
MAYTAHTPRRYSRDELKARIPGWGADLDPADRPSVPQERFDPDATGAHWDFPDRQEEKWPRERSIEHQFLTPVFGTSTPPRGLSGMLRRFAYRYSEARAAHWLLLLAADRVNAVESHLASLITKRPDNPITETGISAEIGRGASARRGTTRVDKTHSWIDPILVSAPWVAGAVAVAYVARQSAKRLVA